MFQVVETWEKSSWLFTPFLIVSILTSDSLVSFSVSYQASLGETEGELNFGLGNCDK